VYMESDAHDIRRYKEFEICPQGEWVDLDVDLNKPHDEDGWTWNSGLWSRGLGARPVSSGMSHADSVLRNRLSATFL
jgi:hypothetical protein